MIYNFFYWYFNNFFILNSIFSKLTYFVSFLSVIFYIVILTIIFFIKILYLNDNFKIKSNVVFKFNLIIIFLIFTITVLYTNLSINIFYSHIVFTSNAKFFFYFIIFYFFISNIFLIIFVNKNFINSIELGSILIFLLLWTLFIFLINNFFSFIFIIELMSLSAFLILILFFNPNSSYNFFFKNSNSRENIIIFFNAFLYIFWISFLSIINLFLFIYLLLKSANSVDFFLIDFIFLLNTINNTQLTFFYNFYIFFIFNFSFFLKLGLVPFFIWKPYFFKSLPYKFIYIYVTIVFFFLFIFFINLLISSFSYFIINYFLLYIVFFFLSFFMIFFVIFNNYNIKIFIATSSILNSINLIYGIFFLII